jgi:hypothetical protein
VSKKKIAVKLTDSTNKEEEEDNRKIEEVEEGRKRAHFRTGEA